MRVLPLNTALAFVPNDLHKTTRLAMMSMLVRALRASLAVSANNRPSFYKWNYLTIWDVDCRCTPRVFKLRDEEVLDLSTDKLQICIHHFWQTSKLKPKTMPVLINLNSALWYADDAADNAPLPDIVTASESFDV